MPDAWYPAPSAIHYFDHNATTPLSLVARDAWIHSSDTSWHNASSLYPEAAHVDHLLEECRVRLADLLDCDEPERIVFTSGATEANNAVIASFARRFPEASIATGATEHPCVLEPSRAAFGESTVRLAVDTEGVLDLASLDTALADRPALVSVMAANNETGTLQPWQDVAERCAAADVPYHCDAAQWLGKLPAAGLGNCPYLTGSAHKFGGPKGVGFLLVPEDDTIVRLAQGGPQEFGKRAGTEDAPGIAAMLSALEEVDSEPFSPAPRDEFEQRILAELPGSRVIGAKAERLPNTSMIELPHTKNLRWLTRLARLGFQVSTGSACSAGKGRPSPVLAAMSQPPESMSRVLRLSSDRTTTEADWQALATAILEVNTELQT